MQSTPYQWLNLYRWRMVIVLDAGLDERLRTTFIPGRVTEQTYQSTNCRNCCNSYDVSMCENRTWPPGENEGKLMARVVLDPTQLPIEEPIILGEDLELNF
jgi:hypothetical protein